MSLFNFDKSAPTKCYGKTNVSGEDIENFVLAMTKIGTDLNNQQMSMQSQSQPSSDPVNSSVAFSSSSSSASSNVAVALIIILRT